MTIPSLITSYNEKVTVNKLWKVYTTLSQALKMAETEHGPISSWGLVRTNTGKLNEDGTEIYNYSGQNLVAKRIKPYLKLSKVCEAGEICINERMCYLNGNCSEPEPFAEGTDGIGFFLMDGTYVGIGWTNQHGDFDISVRFPTGKDVYLGKSMFYFRYVSGRLMPEGYAGTTASASFENRCNVGTNQNGRGCTAWVIYNKNMDYLHCREKLSWDGPHSCKEAE